MGRLTETERGELLRIARSAIEHGLTSRGQPPRLRLDDHPDPLREIGASFVTLHRGGQLRGCIGHLEADQPLVQDVADNACAAAFGDPRFPDLGNEELAGLEIEVSVLTPAVPVDFVDEKDLLRQLRPGRDGLIIEAGGRRATFLPSVWDSLPEPADFLAALKEKAGLWGVGETPGLKAWRYETESFGAEAGRRTG